MFDDTHPIRTMLGPVAAIGLDGGVDRVALSPAVPWGAIIVNASIQRLTGLMLAGSAAGVLEVPESGLAELMTAHEQAMIRSLQVERTLVSLAETFDDAGIRF